MRRMRRGEQTDRVGVARLLPLLQQERKESPSLSSPLSLLSPQLLTRDDEEAEQMRMMSFELAAAVACSMVFCSSLSSFGLTPPPPSTSNPPSRALHPQQLAAHPGRFSLGELVCSPLRLVAVALPLTPSSIDALQLHPFLHPLPHHRSLPLLSPLSISSV